MRKQHELFCCKLCAKHLKVSCHNCATRLSLADMLSLLIVGNLGNSTLRYSPMRGSGTTAKNWLDIGRKATQTTRLIVDIHSVNSVMTDIWITTSCLSTYGEITTFVIFVMQTEHKNTTGTLLFLLISCWGSNRVYWFVYNIFMLVFLLIS